MPRLAAFLTTLALVCVALPGLLPAQAPTTARIRGLASRGDSATARALADSLARASGASPAEQADGIYWRGLLATSPRTRRLEFSRVVVEFPLTPAAGDALYGIARMDLAAGDRAAARRQLERVLRDYGSSPTSGDAAFELGQLLLAEGEARGGCAALDSAVQWTPAEQVEKRNRMSYARRPCATLVLDAPRDSAPPVSGRGSRGSPEPARGGTGGTSTGRGATTRAWSAQVGAFASKADADRVVARLKARGYEARVTSERPFRVRIGRFDKRADAAALVTKLKSEKTAAILVEAERP